MNLKTYLGNPANTVKVDGSFFHEGPMFVFSSPRQEGFGKPKPTIVTIAGRVLSASNNTGMTGNYVPSKTFPKSGKRTALLGKPYIEGVVTDWDNAIDGLKAIIATLTNGDGYDVEYLWQDNDADHNGGAFRFGAPLFRALKPGEPKDASISEIVPAGKEHIDFWKNAIDSYAFTDFPAFDLDGKQIPNKHVQLAIKGATVAIDVIIRGWKFKADKKWGFALDLKQLSVITPAEDEEELELPPLPGSQESTTSTASTYVNNETVVEQLVPSAAKGTSKTSQDLNDATAKARKATTFATKTAGGIDTLSITKTTNKREGSPLAKNNKVAKTKGGDVHACP
ncbi:hypothetical protein GG344DRAFT_83610 [Lentinula edodes]|nr:hypothetical protein GG344DRAFT_83610 [Lentinula edodes]